MSDDINTFVEKIPELKKMLQPFLEESVAEMSYEEVKRIKEKYQAKNAENIPF